MVVCKRGRVYTTGKNMDYLENTKKHWYLTFWFAENGLASTTSKYPYINATLVYIVMDENVICNVQNQR